jgi:ABC-type amino acid transport substrate-binding protein
MLTIPSLQALRSFGSYLSDCGYSAKSFIDQLDVRETVRAGLEELEPLLERTSGDSPLHLLARLFFVGWRADAALCSRVLDSGALSTALACGLLRQSGSDLEPLALLVPFKDLTVACDGVALHRGPDIVMGPSSSTRTLLYSTVPGNFDTTLDLCTGSGVLALNAAASSAHVVGTDINSRALQFARFSAALNRIDNSEFLCGDTFEPVEGRTFSKIIANPPFFMTPVKTFTFSDSPLKLDGFVRRLALEVPMALADGGFFQMTCEWVQIEGEPWGERLQGWTQASGCDVLVLQSSPMTPVAYAEKRSSQMKAIDPNPQEGSFSRRLDALRASRVEAVFGGIVTMRKRRGPNWFASIPAPDTSDSVGPAIREKFDVLTVLASYSEQDLLNARLRFTPGAELVQRTILGAAGWSTTGAVVKEAGFKDQVQLDSVVFQFITLFDGQHSTGEIADLVASRLEIPREEAQQRCLHLARRLLQGSFVLPKSAELTPGR